MDADKNTFMSDAQWAANFPGTQAVIMEEWRARTRAASVLDKCSSTDWKGRFLHVGTTIERPVLPIIKVNDRKPGDLVKYQKLVGKSETFRINRELEVAYHIEIEDEAFSMKNLDSALNKEAHASLAERRDLKFFADAPYKCNALNCGNEAGVVSGAYDLGSALAPVKLFKTDTDARSAGGRASHCFTATEFMTFLTGALKEWPIAAQGDLRIVVPTVLQTLLINSELKYADAMGDSMSVLRKGTNYIGDIDGASIIGCNQLPMWRADVANSLPKRFLVMVLNTKAIQFVDEMIINEKMKDKDQYGYFYRTLNILDWMVDYPELMGYGIVTLG